MTTTNALAEAGPCITQKGKKKSKRFVDSQEDSLHLATLIAGAQESKSRAKAEKHHQIQVGQPRTNHQPRVSAAKAKLKETKAQLAAERARSKKERAKVKKGLERHTSARSVPVELDSIVERVTRKKVSFA